MQLAYSAIQNEIPWTSEEAKELQLEPEQYHFLARAVRNHVNHKNNKNNNRLNLIRKLEQAYGQSYFAIITTKEESELLTASLLGMIHRRKIPPELCVKAEHLMAVLEGYA